MASLLKSTKNTRSIISDSLRYIRSDAILNLEDEEVKWLIENNILTVVDLRTEQEAVKNPCCLKHHNKFTYLNIPVSYGDEMPLTPEMMSPYFLKQKKKKMKKIISIIENSKTNVIYFCRQGKDRSGVVSALLLLRQGISHDEIISDYLLSADNLVESIEQDCRDYPGLKKEAATPNADYMAHFLKCVRL
jgi:protein-tyrosine phosphatase